VIHESKRSMEIVVKDYAEEYAEGLEEYLFSQSG